MIVENHPNFNVALSSQEVETIIACWETLNSIIDTMTDKECDTLTTQDGLSIGIEAISNADDTIYSLLDICEMD